MKITVKQLVRGAVIAALYAGITIFTEAISFGPVQFRVSEALTLLPFLMPEAVWGLTLGCLIANLFGGTVLDIIFGTLATFLAALITKKIKKLWLTPLPVILCNGIIVGAVITLGTYEFNFCGVCRYGVQYCRKRNDNLLLRGNSVAGRPESAGKKI